MTYAEKIEALERQQPDHRLLRIFRMVQSAGNELLLDAELAKVGAPVSAPAPAPEPVALEASVEVEVEDPILTELHREQTYLFGQRRKTSNEFHQCFTDRQRAHVSERIQVIQARIEIVRENIRAFRQHGRLPEADEKYPIPEDPFRLIAMEKSLLASRSRKGREIREIGEQILHKRPGAEERLQKAEAKYKELDTHLNHVRKAIQTRNLQPGSIPEG